MAKDRTNAENLKLLKQRNRRGKLIQYFSTPSTEDITELIIAKDSDSHDDMIEVMQRGVDAGFSDVLEEYDDVIDALASELIEDWFLDMELRSQSAVKGLDEEELESIKEELDVIEVGDEREARKNKILNKVDVVLAEIKIPVRIVSDVKKDLKKKDLDVEVVSTSKVVEVWGRSKKPARVIWGKKGILTYTYLTSAEFRESKPRKKDIPKVEFKFTKKKLREQTPKEIISRKGEIFGIRERDFFESRLKKSDENIVEEYNLEFGNVRTKAEIVRQIKEQRKI